MKVIAIDYAVAGAMLHLYNLGSAAEIHNLTIEHFSDDLQSRVHHNFDVDRTKKIVSAIEKLKIGSFYNDPFADPIFQIHDINIREFFINRLGSGDIYGRSWNLGLDWLKTAFDRDNFWIEFDKESVELVGLLPPADEDVLRVEHNSEAFKEASESLDELFAALETGNDVGNLTASEVAEAKAEISAIKDDLQQETIKLPEFGTKVRTTLGWIAKHAAGALIEKLSLAALAAILKLITALF